jgi:hypothetical protein
MHYMHKAITVWCQDCAQIQGILVRTNRLLSYTSRYSSLPWDLLHLAVHLQRQKGKTDSSLTGHEPTENSTSESFLLLRVSVALGTCTLSRCLAPKVAV